MCNFNLGNTSVFTMFTNERCFWSKIYDLGPEKVFTVHSRGVFTLEDKSCYFSYSKVYGKNGTGKKCSL